MLPDLRRRRPDVDRRDHGRPALRGPADHDARPDGGGELERPEPAAHVAAARPAHARPPGASRRASRPSSAMWGQAVVDPADARAHAARGWCPARSTSAAQGPAPKTLRLRDEKVTRLLGTEVPLGEQARAARAARVRRHRRRRRPRRDRPGLPPQRRHARGRPDRGGRAPVGAGEAPGDDPRPRHERPADGRAEAAPPRGRRARRRRVLRGDRLELPVARDSPRKLRLDAPAVRAAQPAVRGPVGDAHDAARLAARLGPPQHRARARGRAAVRGGLGLLRPPAPARADRRRGALDAAPGRADAPRPR